MGGAWQWIGQGNGGIHPSILPARSRRQAPSPGRVLPAVIAAVYALDVDTYSPAEIVERLLSLRAEHRALDERITRMAANGEDDLESKRLKKRRLQLKDCIARLESLQIPDEPA